MQTVMAAVETSSDSIPWLGPVIALFVGLSGGGGVVAWFRLRHDRRIGVAQQEVAEDDALANRWKSIIEAQTTSLLEPMATRLRDVEAKVADLEGQLGESKRKYWSAIGYSRSLLAWIAQHLPGGDRVPPPDPPALIAGDI